MAIALGHLSKYLRHFHSYIRANDVMVFLSDLFYEFRTGALYHSVDEILQRFDETMKKFLPEPRVLTIEEEEEEEDEICRREKRKNGEGDDDGGDEKRIKSE